MKVDQKCREVRKKERGGETKQRRNGREKGNV